MRYLVAKNSTTGELRPFLGLAPTTHRDLADNAASLGYDQPVSAGFVHMGPATGVTTHYRSESLGLEPGPHDASLIQALYRATLDLVPEFQLRRAGAPAGAHTPSTATHVH